MGHDSMMLRGRDFASPTFSLLNIPVSLEEEVEPQSRWRFTCG
jgi:hypothetical protein